MKVKAVFEDIYENYDLVNTVITFGFIKLFRRLLFMNISPGYRAIELGAGTGANISFLLNKFEEIYCVDPSQNMLNVLQKRCSSSSVRIVKSHAEEFFLPDCDLIVCSFSLRNFYDLETSLRNIVSMLKVGGVLLVMDVFRPKSRFTQNLLRLYFDIFCIPIGAMLTGNKASYQYFRDSIFDFITFSNFTTLLLNYGFRTNIIFNFFGLGILKAIKQ
ncbi:MAG: class I SAM-dependent methyltransferase [Deltaproteobacteria bacterium]|nr:class I SAM-dependent methyltransferase [Deltaproteobacteria bacterium]